MRFRFGCWHVRLRFSGRRKLGLGLGLGGLELDGLVWDFGLGAGM
jgi:hypothetical protein